MLNFWEGRIDNFFKGDLNQFVEQLLEAFREARADEIKWLISTNSNVVPHLDHTFFNNRVKVYQQSSLSLYSESKNESIIYMSCGHVATEAMAYEWSNWMLFSWESTLLADYKVGKTTTRRKFGSWRHSRWPNLVRFSLTKWETLTYYTRTSSIQSLGI